MNSDTLADGVELFEYFEINKFYIENYKEKKEFRGLEFTQEMADQLLSADVDK